MEIHNHYAEKSSSDNATEPREKVQLILQKTKYYNIFLVNFKRKKTENILQAILVWKLKGKPCLLTLEESSKA